MGHKRCVNIGMAIMELRFYCKNVRTVEKKTSSVDLPAEEVKKERIVNEKAGECFINQLFKSA